MKTVKKVYISNVRREAKIINSNVLYKVEILDDGSKLVKARVAPHENKDSMKDELKKDSAICSPVGIRVALSVCSIKKWNIAEILHLLFSSRVKQNAKFANKFFWASVYCSIWTG